MRDSKHSENIAKTAMLSFAASIVVGELLRSGTLSSILLGDNIDQETKGYFDESGAVSFIVGKCSGAITGLIVASTINYFAENQEDKVSVSHSLMIGSLSGKCANWLVNIQDNGHIGRDL
ncbi:MAG: hypothetical protein HOM96_02070 [Rickettsiales bacterium]|jgi:hypothetical protein|nr:hypothetical protein [Rickettsiales bacterium]